MIATVSVGSKGPASDPVDVAPACGGAGCVPLTPLPEPSAGAQVVFAQPSTRVVARARRNLVILPLDEVWAFEAKDRLCFVHSLRGRFDIDTSLAELESRLGTTFARVHRKWLANLANVREFAMMRCEPYLLIGNWSTTEHGTLRVPVAREQVITLRQRLLINAVGLRRSRAGQARPVAATTVAEAVSRERIDD